MPVEIKELHIKAIVSDGYKQKNQPVAPVDIAKIKREVVKECVQEVLQKLKEKSER